jgi:anti-sigma factor RsiW
MRCDRARLLINPLVDGELDAENRTAVAAHIKICPGCTTFEFDIGRSRRLIAEGGRVLMPRTLIFRVRSSLAVAVRQHEVEKRKFLIGYLPTGMMSQATALAAACALSILLTWSFMTSSGQVGRERQEILSAHLRSLLQEGPPIQVASSDSHRVKPWFAGRIEFAPDVKDLTAQGFPLLGGRLDYIQQRRVAALVYQRRSHLVNVFIWPSSNIEDVPPKLITENGYNLLVWNRGGVTFWAVSDLDAREMIRFQSVL